MSKFNLPCLQSIEQCYQQGLLPQRNLKGLFYQADSSRSRLDAYRLSSENKRILKLTQNLNFQIIPLKDFNLTPEILSTCHRWSEQLNWHFPKNSIKTVFTKHIFNYLYIWQKKERILAYAVCLFTPSISHLAYLFYQPQSARQNLVIRAVLQVIIDSRQKSLDYCYLGNFNSTQGFYKRNMPGFEFFAKNRWFTYNK